MTMTEAKNLRKGQILHHTTRRNSDGSPQRWKVNGKVKTWKDGRIRIPVKHGLYTHGAIENDSLDLVRIAA